MTDYKWELKQRKEQKKTFLAFRSLDNNLSQAESLRLAHRTRNELDPDIAETYNMLTTVSIPVYDRRESAVSSNLNIKHYIQDTI